MIRQVLGLSPEQAEALFPDRECVVETTLPPRRQEKTGAARVVRAAFREGKMVLTVSYFDDTAEKEEEHAG